MNIERIAIDLRDGVYQDNPHQAAHDVSMLAGDFYFLCAKLEAILQKKPATWNTLRPNYKSDTACEKAWEKTSEGIEEMSLKLMIKSAEKMMSALRSIIRVHETQAKNQF